MGAVSDNESMTEPFKMCGDDNEDDDDDDDDYYY